MINYSLVARSTNPTDKNSEQRVYAVSQYNRQLKLRDIAKHLAAHGSPFSVGTILGLLTDAVTCMVENLKEGNRVDLDDMGDFYVTLSSEGAENADKFTSSMIRRVNLRWRSTDEMLAEMQTVGFNYVPSREGVEELKRTEKRKLNERMAGVLENGEEPEDGGGITSGGDQTE